MEIPARHEHWRDRKPAGPLAKGRRVPADARSRGLSRGFLADRATRHHRKHAMNTRDSESSVERLIKLAGEPDLPTSEGMRRARAAGEIAWRQMLAQREASPLRGRMLMLGFALAASLALVAWLVIRPASQSAVPAAIGQVIALEG